MVLDAGSGLLLSSYDDFSIKNLSRRGGCKLSKMSVKAYDKT